jgi:hypothetical protein
MRKMKKAKSESDIPQGLLPRRFREVEKDGVLFCVVNEEGGNEFETNDPEWRDIYVEYLKEVGIEFKKIWERDGKGEEDAGGKTTG